MTLPIKVYQIPVASAKKKAGRRKRKRAKRKRREKNAARTRKSARTARKWAASGNKSSIASKKINKTYFHKNSLFSWFEVLWKMKKEFINIESVIFYNLGSIKVKPIGLSIK